MYRIVGLIFVALLLLVAVGLLVAAPRSSLAAVFQGTVIRVDASKNVIEVSDKEELEQEFAVAESCEITLDGKEAGLKELVAGTVVSITIKKVKDKQVAVKIVGNSPE